MTKDDIIRMARDVGILDFRDEDNSEYVKDVLDDLERFASLVAAAEREACAKLCDEIGSDLWIGDADEASVAKCAAAIRARSTP